MNRYWHRFLLLLGLVVLISGAVIYATVDMHTLTHLNAFQPWAVALALVFLAIGMYFDGIRLSKLVILAGERISFGTALQVIFGNYFLALLTPGAAGGAVAQVMFLRRAGIPLGKATILVLVRTLLSILFLLICMPVIFYYDPALIPWLSPGMLALVALILVAISFGGMLFLQTRLSLTLVLAIIKRMRPGNGRRRMILHLYRDLRAAVRLLFATPAGVIQVFVESGLSLLALYAIVPMLFLGLGIAVDWPIVMGRMIFLNLLLYFAPTPGGSGIAEGGFVLLFNDYLPPGTVGILAVAWRILAEYVPFAIGFYYTIKVFGRDFLTRRK
ncbi:lysylphosphatidylglycerol synthase transmembrane domain-containing protein [Anaerospora sp.]|jgi:uncharacterized protein (TIRG00374 family)|uniref:lysylphosphatidylglycerol synthase transmembrane domain-containing protein n=1 Tax=Anaerospora sp. TaxID=1960278 RepID=UPI0028A044FC|nr:lysylphosphatidylglycerol synthase transmembrane domain-containing protein [Anaerospora sp.]MDF2928761.1 Lysylphosphatidylglycerol synthetase/glycosyltransferase AglD [Anaerospora sp.]